MNTITGVRMALVLLMLCSGLFLPMFATQRLRLFGDLLTKGPDFVKASQICVNDESSLVTAYDEEDAKFLYSYTNAVYTYPDHYDTNGGIRPVWLGLHHVENYTWSNGDPVLFNQTSEKLGKGEQKCEAIHENKWQSFNCSEKKYFMCSKGNVTRQNKTWCQALQYCRNKHSELVSINSTEQNDEVIKKGQNSSFWIRLRHDEWKWSDNGCSSFREWKRSQEEGKKAACTQIAVEENSQSIRLYDFGCDSQGRPLCVKGHVRIKVIEENKTWEEAHDYCKEIHSRPLWIKDENDQKAVEQWLQHTDASGPFWIGLRQSRVFGFWIWSDSVVVYSNWKGKDPEPSMYDLCGVIDTKNNNKWREEKCLKRLPFLCEEDIIYV